MEFIPNLFNHSPKFSEISTKLFVENFEAILKKKKKPLTVFSWAFLVADV